MKTVSVAFFSMMAMAIGLGVPKTPSTLPSPASGAQQWSADQQEVLDVLESCWNTWMEALAANDPEMFISACWHEDGMYWWTVDGAPNDTDFLRRQWETFAKNDERWVDYRPVAVRVFGDVAIINFYGYWQAPLDGRSVITEAKRTEVLQRQNGRWMFIAGHSSPVSPADAAPYR